jgi:hypothetical protein
VRFIAGAQYRRRQKGDVIMRLVAFAALAALTLCLAGPRPASAAWECVGPEYVCAGTAEAPKKAWKKAGAEHRAPKLKRTARGLKATRSAHYATKPRKRLASGKPHRRDVSVATDRGTSGGSVGIASYYWQGSAPHRGPISIPAP